MHDDTSKHWIKEERKESAREGSVSFLSLEGEQVFVLTDDATEEHSGSSTQSIGDIRTEGKT